MNLHWIDWLIVGIVVSGMISLATYTKRYVHGVADFLAADRMAGKYLLTVSGTWTGTIGMVGAWQMLFCAGLPTQWWAMMLLPIGLFISLSGFITYRFRQTRALTVAQFFEIRYSRSFRFFAGTLCWISGILNYGIFPAVTARLIIAFFGLPDYFNILGMEISSFPAIMITYLTLAVYIACTGGQISIMLADFAQETFSKMILVIMICYLMCSFNWDDIMTGLQFAPEGKSMINPFKSGDIGDFNIWYFLIGIYGGIYNARSWQGTSGFNAAAKTPHDAQMAGILGNWRLVAFSLCQILPPIVAYAVMHNDKFVALASIVQSKLDLIKDPQLYTQMATPLFMAQVLPMGFIGCFAALIIGGAISCDDTYTHAWGSIFIQDVVMPLRKKPFEPKLHILLLRLSIIGVAVFGFTFSMLFPLKDFIFMFFALTGAIYLGGAGAIIIGGLYWKRGTTAAAWAAMSAGTVLAFGGMLIEQTWQPYLAPWLTGFFPDWQYLASHQSKFPINGQTIYFLGMIGATATYILVSLLGPRQEFNMDKLLHRGKYAIVDDNTEAADALKKKMSLSEKLGITKEFSKFERFVYWATLYWSLGWWGIFLGGTLLNFFYPVSDFAWSWFWWLKIWLSLIVGIVTTVWILTGGIYDTFRLFKDLKKERVDYNDDGFVKMNKKS